MRALLLFLVISILDLAVCIAQTETSTDETFFGCPFEQMPEFPGGIAALQKFLSANIHFPDSARQAHVYGKVYIAFTIGIDGSVIDAIVARGIGYGCDEEALRVVRMMPCWKPCKQGAKPIALKQAIPIVFDGRTK